MWTLQWVFEKSFLFLRRFCIAMAFMERGSGHIDDDIEELHLVHEESSTMFKL